MEQQEYEYHGMLAAAWDLLRGDTSIWPDRPFYRQLIEEYGQPALDVGCGTGRLLLDYLAAGLAVEGVDNSPEMLALCRKKAEQLALQPVLYQQSMEALDLPHTYRTIFVPSSSFQLLTDQEQAAEAMRRFFFHLEPGGLLVMPFMLLYSGEVPANSRVEEDWRMLAERQRPEDSALVRRWSRSTLDTHNQLEHTEDRYEVLVDGKVIAEERHRRSPATRWYSQSQALQLYRQAGFTNLQVLHAFTRQPAAKGEELFTILGIRPADAEA